MESLLRRRCYGSVAEGEDLRFIAEEDGSFTFKFAGTEGYGQSSIAYRKNDDTEWTNIEWSSYGTVEVEVSEGDVVYWRGIGDGHCSKEDAGHSQFICTADFHMEGSMMSLIFGKDHVKAPSLRGKCGFPRLFEGCTTLTSAKDITFYSKNTSYSYKAWETNYIEVNSYYYGYAFYQTFRNCTGLTDASFSIGENQMIKPFMFYRAFEGCTSLVNAPKISAAVVGPYGFAHMFQKCTSLKSVDFEWGKLADTNNRVGTGNDVSEYTSTYACGYMFQGCISLTIAPIPTYETLSPYCYSFMFKDCTNLTTVSSLPSTKLAENCYYGMFYNCTSLVTAPSSLPATTLAEYCYRNMFWGCTKLTTAPTLKGVKLVSGCYASMFNGCSSLNYIDISSWQSPLRLYNSDTTNFTYTSAWVYGVASTGTLIKSKSTDFGIYQTQNTTPKGWTVQSV